MLAQPGVKYVVVQLGINDIIVPASPDAPAATVAQLIAAHRQIIERAHALGLAVFGGTITPFGGTRLYTAAGEAKRQALNHWIRTSGAHDAVIDFDRVLRDPQQPTFLCRRSTAAIACIRTISATRRWPMPSIYRCSIDLNSAR